MRKATHPVARGFTLIELLAVIAIIALLIGVLVPTVSSVRDQARKGATRAQLASLGKSCEAFHTEIGKYPRSFGENPFLGNRNRKLSGAQWLVVQLVGPDLQGYVEPDRRNDTNGDGNIDNVDWAAWYDPDNAISDKISRESVFAEVSSENVVSPEVYARDNGLELPGVLDPGAGTGDEWNNGRVPFFVETFGFPVLYYRANAQAKNPFTTWNGANIDEIGRYDLVHNEAFTGSEYEDGFNLGGGKQTEDGGMWELGWDPANPKEQPEPRTFANALYDRGLYEQSQEKVWPHNPDTFILVSPGKDGLYGTGDDVTNF